MPVTGSQIGTPNRPDQLWCHILDREFVAKVQLAMAIPRHKALFDFDGKEYFRAADGNVYCKVRE